MFKGIKKRIAQFTEQAELENKQRKLNSIQKDYPIFENRRTDKQFVYLDNAATSLTPKQVVTAITEYYEKYSANIHRGIYATSEAASEVFDDTRTKVAEFINTTPDTIIYTQNTTDSINLVANSIAQTLKSGENIVVSIMEHHSNFVPWQLLCKEKGVELRIVNITADGMIDIRHAEELIDEKTKIVAVTQLSNVLGTMQDVKKITQIAHKKNALVLIDAAQSIAHIPVDVKKIDCDFLAFSAHKMYGPTGIGILYAKQQHILNIGPRNTGGGMITQVTKEITTLKQDNTKFDAGTPHIAGVFGVHASIEYIQSFGIENIQQHEKNLTQYALQHLQKLNFIDIIGKNQQSVISFTVKEIHPHDVAQILDGENICVRAGHHCAQPLMQHLKKPATVRISFSIYNTINDIDALILALKKTQEVFT
jgi:cysteine desulfurase / selenocysteine lyase